MKSKIIENLVKENAQLFAKYLESNVVDLEESHENMDVRIIQIEKESNANFQYQCVCLLTSKLPNQYKIEV